IPIAFRILAAHASAPRVARDFYGRAQKISPARAGPSQREETPPVQGHPQNIRVGCACYGQLQLAPACAFWNTVFDETLHRFTFCCRNGAILRPSDEESS